MVTNYFYRSLNVFYKIRLFNIKTIKNNFIMA